MSSSSTRRPSTFNFPLAFLWLASAVVAAGGYLLMTMSNTKEATIYASGTADYPKLFAAQSGSTVGGMLIAVGVLGALLALVTIVLRRPVAVPVVEAPFAEDRLVDDAFDDEPVAETAAGRASAPSVTTDAPADAPADAHTETTAEPAPTSSNAR